MVAQPTDADDVRTALLWAQEHGVDLAVKGGGHSVAGTSSSAGGLVIDLSRMNTVTVDVTNKTVSVGGGAVWKDVDEKAAKYGLAAVGGTVNHTGVGGLTLGGGYGWLSGEHGLTIDNLLAATVVLADGTTVRASATEHEDLYWALRGAGYNFGVVTEFVFQAHDQPNPIWAGIVAFPPEKLEAVIESLNATLQNPDPRAGAMCIFAQPPGAPCPMVNVLAFYNGTREEGERRFAQLLSLEPVVNTINVIPYDQLNSLQNPMATYGGRKSFKGVYFQPPLDTKFIRGVFEEFCALNAAHEDLVPAILLEFYDMRKTCSVPLASTAFANRMPSLNGLLNLRWNDESKDGFYRGWARELQAKFKAQFDAQVGAGTGDVPQYINYAEREYLPTQYRNIILTSLAGDVVVNNIYGENLPRLQKVKAQYDPTNVFSKMHPIVKRA